MTAQPHVERAHRLWEVCEPIHAVSYFDRSVRRAARAAGAESFWQGYVAGRLGPLGLESGDAAAAMLYVFEPGFVITHCPPPEVTAAVWSARVPAVAAALAGLADGLRPMLPELEEAANLLLDTVSAGSLAGRPLAAAHAGLRSATSGWARVWLAATVVREYRWGGHVAVLVGRRLSGLEAMLIGLLWRDLPLELATADRGWPSAAVDDALTRLEQRNLIAGRSLSVRGRDFRASVERATNELAVPVEADVDAVDHALDTLEPLSALCRRAIPWDNPIGIAGSGASLAGRTRKD